MFPTSREKHIVFEIDINIFRDILVVLVLEIDRIVYIARNNTIPRKRVTTRFSKGEKSRLSKVQKVSVITIIKGVLCMYCLVFFLNRVKSWCFLQEDVVFTNHLPATTLHFFDDLVRPDGFDEQGIQSRCFVENAP